MSNSLVIVAIPAEDERVWKISSEKVPHLTLLYLGDATSNPNVDRITEFVAHAVATSEHGPFMLDVDYRDVLGPDEADVVFFRKGWETKWIEQFRGQLLQNNDIRTAYDSSEQFDEWQPHLTLGYPETPAKEDDSEHGFNWISFDRIAVWTGNYEGNEFRLSWPDRESDGLAVAYSEAASTGGAIVSEFLSHHGIKGMRWGQKKTETITTNGKTQQVTPKQAKKADKNWKKDFETGKGFGFDDQKFVKDYNEKWKDHDFSKEDFENPSHDYQRYENGFYEAMSHEYTKQYISHYGSSPSGKMKAVRGSDSQEIKIVHTDVKHADDVVAVFKITRDSKGLITSTKQVEDTMKQTAEAGAEFLSHHGIKGMRWGHRSSRPAPSVVPSQAMSVVPHGARTKTTIKVAGGENHPAHEDAIKVAESRAKLAKSGPAALSNKELGDVAKRMQLEGQVKQLTQNSGHKFVSSLLKQQGQQQANRFVQKKARETIG